MNDSFCWTDQAEQAFNMSQSNHSQRGAMGCSSSQHHSQRDLVARLNASLRDVSKSSGFVVEDSVAEVLLDMCGQDVDVAVAFYQAQKSQEEQSLGRNSISTTSTSSTSHGSSFSSGITASPNNNELGGSSLGGSSQRRRSGRRLGTSLRRGSAFGRHHSDVGAASPSASVSASPIQRHSFRRLPPKNRSLGASSSRGLPTISASSPSGVPAQRQPFRRRLPPKHTSLDSGLAKARLASRYKPAMKRNKSFDVAEAPMVTTPNTTLSSRDIIVPGKAPTTTSKSNTPRSKQLRGRSKSFQMFADGSYAGGGTRPATGKDLRSSSLHGRVIRRPTSRSSFSSSFSPTTTTTAALASTGSSTRSLSGRLSTTGSSNRSLHSSWRDQDFDEFMPGKVTRPPTAATVPKTKNKDISEDAESTRRKLPGRTLSGQEVEPCCPSGVAA